MPSEVVPRDGSSSAGGEADSVPEGRRFEIPVSTAVLRILQGSLCLFCRIAGGQLDRAGRACSVSPDGCEIWWDVRAHAKCLREAS